ncbi:type VI secretion system-associated protein TagF [Elioraea rosea]|uniref:type VI secretion system-associated protein TagF n=1 Tax=Elioraea rosea TaxID=2492390 RepID=UPI0011861AE0|nr:type VI secretion system-associated protein TagF [Elioraea rosea]
MPDLAALTLRGRMRQGFFGKLPGHGDFVRADLPEEIVSAWDLWVREGLAESRTVLGEAWLPAFLEAPVWRFRFAPGTLAAVGFAGVMAPSVDKAGRYFPLMLCAVSDRAPEPEEAPAWFDALAAAAADAVHDGWDRGRLNEALEAAGHPPAAPRAHPGVTFATEGAPRVAPARLHFPSLPAPRIFATLLADGSAP